MFLAAVVSVNYQQTAVYGINSSARWRRWLSKLSPDPQPNGTAASAPAAYGSNNSMALLASSYLCLPCAMIRGALLELGLDCMVTADCATLPACAFTISIKQPR